MAIKQYETSASHKHDAITKWILDNARKYVEPRYDPAIQLSKISMPDLIMGKPCELKTKPILEYLLSSKHDKFTDAYIDVLLEVLYPYADLEPGRWVERLDAFCFEAKSDTPSLGDLMRQIRKYQHYFSQNQYHSVMFVVVSPDIVHRDIIRDQGIEFWECPPIPELLPELPLFKL